MADGSIWDWLAPAAATIGGTALVANANTNAANTAGNAAITGAQIANAGITQAEQNQQAYATDAQQRAAAAEADALARSQAAEQEAQAQAAATQTAAQQQIAQAKAETQAIYGGAQTQTQPGVSYLRQVVATPDTLTASQQQALADNRLAEANTMHSTSFAGSGRAGAALLKRSDSDFINSSLDTNRARALTAAGTLAGQNMQATGGIANASNTAGAQNLSATETAGQQGYGATETAGQQGYGAAETLGNQDVNIDTNTGNAITGLIAKSGQNSGTAVSNAGLYQAQGGVATGAAMGRAIGDIGSAIKTQNKSAVTGITPSSYSSSPTATRLGTMDGSPGNPRPSSYDSSSWGNDPGASASN